MVKDTFSRLLVLIVILIDVLHSLIRIAFGDIWIDNLFILLSTSLWITVFLSLYSSINRCEKRGRCACVILILAIVQFFNAWLVFLSDTSVYPNLHKIITLSAYIISFMQVLVTFIAGFTLKNYKDKPIRILGKVFIIQSLLYFITLLCNQLISHSLNRANTIALIADFYYVATDVLEIFVLIYIYKVFGERYEE